MHGVKLEIVLKRHQTNRMTQIHLKLNLVT